MLLQIDGLTTRLSQGGLAGLDLALDFGEVAALMGPHGGGAETLLRVAAGLVEPHKGRVRIFNIDLGQNRRRALDRIGFVAAGAPAYPEMTPWDYLRFLAEARGMRRDAARIAVHKAANAARLDDSINDTIRLLTPGFRTRVALAAALLHDPALLVLDAPFDGLDPGERLDLRRVLLRAGEDRGILFTSHDLAVAEALATRIIIVAGGRIVADGAPEAVAERFGEGDLEAAYLAAIGTSEAA